MGDSHPDGAALPIDLSVVHGHLAFARFPVLVGHYNGDTLAGTEARLDRALGGRLSDRRAIGLYPGRIGTSMVLLDPTSGPSGAVVVGLGEAADLSVGTLREALRQGILAFLAETMDQARACPDAEAAKAPLGLSALLVGAGEGGLDRHSCVSALLQGANQASAMWAGLATPHPRLGSIEIVELWEDRALETWRAVNKAVESDPALSNVFSLADAMTTRVGGRPHAPIGRDPNWWQPIQITMSRAEAPADRSLSFTIGGGLARAEARTIAADLDFVAPLLRRTFRNIDPDGSATSPGRILFELLWPESLKNQSADDRSRRLILDEASAAFPWELLDDRRPWIDGEGVHAPVREPPAVRARMVRQLLQSRSREKSPPPRGEPRALVIGDPGAQPMEGFRRLPGAKAEAEAIADLLANDTQPYAVTKLVEAAATPEQICKQLFGQSWEIIHISAHGVVDTLLAGPDGARRRVTGVVLGGGIVLGPSTLSKLPVSPSIVFVNCCNLGKIDAAAEDKARQESLEGRPEFAASLAVELIGLGAPCVIVAGWEVDDAAAKIFGETFYSEMLEGATFGDATWRARRAAYDPGRNCNTWGAYQCYGDPDYRLRPARPDRPSKRNAHRFEAVSEAFEAAQQISGDVNIGLERDHKTQRARVAAIEEESKSRNWYGSARLRVALAEARAELGDLAEAIDHYVSAVAGEDADFKVKAVEQLANLRARKAVLDFRSAPVEKRDLLTTIATIKGEIERVQRLMEAVGLTPERLSLEAGCFKRLAQLQASTPAADEALREMADRYGRAASLPGKGAEYPRLMACSAQICRAVRSGGSCDEAIGHAVGELASSPLSDKDSFWDLVRWADAQTALAILRESAPSADDTGRIMEAYRRAWLHVGSPVKMRSVVEQLEFYQDIFADGSPETAARRVGLGKWIADIKSSIDTISQG